VKVLGIISEYNPLHNGHLYHINQSIQQVKPDYTIVVMSGNVVQRGKLALMDKWSRTSIALQANIDLVIELPSIFACQSAESFAFGAIQLLTKLGIVTDLSFGSESNNLPALQAISDILVEEPVAFKTFLHEQLNSGCGFASARARALIHYFTLTNQTPLDPVDITTILSASNDILGIEYLKAIKQLNANLIVHTVKRQGPGYHSQAISEAFVSATKIRSMVCSSDIISAATYMPHYSYHVLQTALTTGSMPDHAIYSKLALFHLRSLPTKTLSQISDVSEGLEHRILREAHHATTLTDLIEAIKTKRYTYTRINRIILSAVLNITQEQLSFYLSNGSPYVRILGFKQDALVVLKHLKQTCPLPIITKPSAYQWDANIAISRLILLESAITDLFYLVCKNPLIGSGGKEFSTPIIIQRNSSVHNLID
jgi:predicted nucleotidyltransferase